MESVVDAFVDISIARKQVHGHLSLDTVYVDIEEPAGAPEGLVKYAVLVDMSDFHGIRKLLKVDGKSEKVNAKTDLKAFARMCRELLDCMKEDGLQEMVTDLAVKCEGEFKSWTGVLAHAYFFPSLSHTEAEE